MNKLIILLLIFIGVLLSANVYLFGHALAKSQLDSKLCDRINVLEFQLTETELTDCELVYK